jgi:hypothetical protein
MNSVNLTEDLACFIRDAVSSGRYASEDSVITDALVRLRLAIMPDDKSLDPGADRCQPGKPLTKQHFQRHLMNIGLMDVSTETAADADNADGLIDDQGEVLSEVVIRERLIEWLAGFL